MGAHHAGRKTWAPGRHHRLNQALEALFVLALIAAAAFSGWVSTVPARPLGSVLNPPVVAAVPSRPAEPPAPPVPSAELGHGSVKPQVRPPRKKEPKGMRKVSATKRTPMARGRS